ncbi:hypothetical protein Dgeo_3041 (plasmid) [Deinococcus geothermalis DSM 11300]|uniref:Uncharacterized protein n=1 Tax=Deinococcus geothermalis (strain DSM 11300 / CIP 105573 / AG-3a) TaxID=319795 RepID=A8ZRH3_DEIGD|nr:hypothetical protein [Deinococcus geothermalis]ABW35082.1 hypothetical protein Dgeo_3041 [Deinococcus geothermalis DSM 11300]
MTKSRRVAAPDDTQPAAADGTPAAAPQDTPAAADAAPSVIEPPSPPAAPVDPPIHAHTPISARAYAEETPRLTREARDILCRIHGQERHTREEWDALAQKYGGKR